MAAQARFEAVHGPVVGFVVVSHQVKQSVKGQNTQFGLECAAKSTRVTPCDGGSNGDIAEIIIFASNRSVREAKVKLRLGNPLIH